MRGLLDQYTLASNEQAFGMVKRMAAWVGRRVNATLEAGGEDLWQRVLLTEWGGVNDVLFELYHVTGDMSYLATGRKFNAYIFTAPLLAGQDSLAQLPFPHANFHLPEVVGNANAYRLTKNASDQAVSRNFFDILYTNHSFATGGSNSGECWQAPGSRRPGHS